MSPNNWTLSISLSRHNLIRRLPSPTRTMWWMSLLKKKISNIHLPPNYWMKNWEFIIRRVLILRSPTPKFRVHLSSTSQLRKQPRRSDPEIVLCMAVKCDSCDWWEGKSVSKKAFLVMIRLACGALFWTFTKSDGEENRDGMTSGEKEILNFLLFSFTLSAPKLFGLFVPNCV